MKNLKAVYGNALAWLSRCRATQEVEPFRRLEAPFNKLLDDIVSLIGRVDVHDLLSLWMLLIQDVACQAAARSQISPKHSEIMAGWTAVAVERLIIAFHDRSLRVSRDTHLEVFTVLAQQLLVLGVTPIPTGELLREAERLTAVLDPIDQRSAVVTLQEFSGRTQAIFDAYDESGTNPELGHRVRASIAGGSGDCKYVPLFFATFRKLDKRAKNNAYLRFGGSWADKLTFGSATVSVPISRQKYSRERDHSRESSFKEHSNIDLGRYFYLLPATPIYEEQAFFSELKAAVNEKTLMVFVHGFRQTHADALITTAQLFEDLGLQGAPLTLSWPSGFILGSESYFDALEQYKKNSRILKFAEVIRRAASDSDAENILLIGHSLGCRVLCDLTNRIHFDQKNISNIVLASPDIEVKDFNDAIKPAATAKKKIFVYASRRDKALEFAQVFGGVRAGANPARLSGSGYDRLEIVSTEGCFYDTPDFWRHSDYSCGAAEDLKSALEGASTKRRRLVESRTATGKYWSIA
ncbi:MAG: alpha/beta hydrolase [Rhodomicrobium sp.]